MNKIKTDVVIVGTGASGLFAALHLPAEKQILMLTKDTLENSDSFLAQGGICVLRDEEDYESFFEDTLKAGHYENNPASVEVMIRSSREVISELIEWGVDFAKIDGDLAYTREGCHSRPRILFHEDITGKEITSKLLKKVKSLPNVKMLEHMAMTDILEAENCCAGVVAEDRKKEKWIIEASHTILATGGIGGLYEHSTNFPHLTGDALAIAMNHGVELEHVDYVQIHPTTLYSGKPGRRFLISESVRGEGAKLYDKNGKRFADEVLPRDILTEKIRRQMELDKTPYVWLDMTVLGEKTIQEHFPNIYRHCLEEGFDVTKDWIPVVPAQHYFMGGIKVDLDSHTSMERLYAVGETACNGVHGANRLASNSLLESLVFAKRAAYAIVNRKETILDRKKAQGILRIQENEQDGEKNWQDTYKKQVLEEIRRQREMNRERKTAS